MYREKLQVVLQKSFAKCEMGPKIINLLPHRVVLPAVFRVVYIMVHSQARHEDGTATISCKEIHENLKVSKSQKPFFLKFHCPKNNQNIK